MRDGKYSISIREYIPNVPNGTLGHEQNVL